MKHIPILYSTAMVQAKLEKRKSQTRRLNGLDKINASPNEWEFVRFFDGYAKFTEKHNALNEVYVKCPYGQPGDVLWVRESWRSMGFDTDKNSMLIQYKDESHHWVVMNEGYPLFAQKKWKPSIHMPKAACRMWDMVKGVRVERLQDISEKDAMAEGIIEVSSFVFAYEKQNPKGHYSHASLAYKYLWQSLNGADSWNANPWVWVVEFEPCAMPEDFLTR